MATQTEALDRVRGLIERGWTQESFARNEVGIPVEPDAADAVCFCLLGAFKRVSWDLGYDTDWVMEQVRETLRAEIGHGSIVDFNDEVGRTKDDVLAVFDKTAKRVRAQEA